MLSRIVVLVAVLFSGVQLSYAENNVDICRAVFARDAISKTYNRKKSSFLLSEIRDILCDSSYASELWSRRSSLSIVLEGVPLDTSDSLDGFRQWQQTICKDYVKSKQFAENVDSIAQQFVDNSPALEYFVRCLEVINFGAPSSFAHRILPGRDSINENGNFRWSVKWKRPVPNIEEPVVTGFDVVGAECEFHDGNKAIPLIFRPGYRLSEAVEHIQTCRRLDGREISLTLRTTLGAIPASIPAVRPKLPDLIVDKELVLRGTWNQIVARKISFKKGGKIKILGGTKLIIRAHSIVSDDGSQIVIDGRGSKGTKGATGTACNDGACGEWWTDRKEDYEEANRNCLPNEIGGKGGQGHPGTNGAEIEIYVADKYIEGTMVCDVEGGDGGDGGEPGAGRWHVHNTGGLPRYQCSNRGKGERGSKGKAGTCRVSVGVAE